MDAYVTRSCTAMFIFLDEQLKSEVSIAKHAEQFLHHLVARNSHMVPDLSKLSTPEPFCFNRPHLHNVLLGFAICLFANSLS